MSWRSGFRLIKIEFALSCNYMGGQQCISSLQWRFSGAVNLVLAFNLLKALISAEWNPNFLRRSEFSPPVASPNRASAVNKITSLMTFIPAQWLIQDLPLSISLMLFEWGPGGGWWWGGPHSLLLVFFPSSWAVLNNEGSSQWDIIRNKGALQQIFEIF